MRIVYLIFTQTFEKLAYQAQLYGYVQNLPNKEQTLTFFATVKTGCFVNTYLHCKHLPAL